MGVVSFDLNRFLCFSYINVYAWVLKKYYEVCRLANGAPRCQFYASSNPLLFILQMLSYDVYRLVLLVLEIVCYMNYIHASTRTDSMKL